MQDISKEEDINYKDSLFVLIILNLLIYLKIERKPNSKWVLEESLLRGGGIKILVIYIVVSRYN